MTEGQLEQEPLATLRDTLLPRLISGQLHLPEAEAAVEAALYRFGYVHSHLSYHSPT